MHTTNLIPSPEDPSIRCMKERDTEVSRLKSLSDGIPAETAWGESNMDAMDAQIEVISECMIFKEITKEHKEDTDYVMSLALDALEWLRGDGEAPSEKWLRMIEEGVGGVRYSGVDHGILVVDVAGRVLENRLSDSASGHPSNRVCTMGKHRITPEERTR